MFATLARPSAPFTLLRLIARTRRVANLVAKLVAVKKEARVFKWISLAASILLMITIGAVFGVSMAAAELAKESHIKGD